MKSDGPGAGSSHEPVASSPPKQSARPPLDLEALEKRLKDTEAIGLFTKLALKNQVDDLLDRFRSFYVGQLDVPLGELRQSYELLLLKTITVVQDGDPALANAIASSREPLWEMLADRDQFAALAGGL